MSLGHPIHHGSELVREMQKAPSMVLSLNDTRVQVFLARLAFPEDPEAMKKWLEGDERSNIPPLYSRFRAYDTEHRVGEEHATVDIKDVAQLTALLEEIKLHAPETRH